MAEKQVGWGEWMRNLHSGMERVRPGYGTKILVQLFLTYFLFCKSLAYALMYDSYVPYMKYLGVEGNVANDLFVVVRAPWSMKPLWAMLSDALPIMGYKKRYYILIGVGIAVFALVLLVITNFTEEGAAGIVAFLFFTFVAGTTMVDSMTQAYYTVLMKETKDTSVVSYVWFLLNACGLFAFYNVLIDTNNDIVGYDLKHKILLIIAIPISVPMLFPAAMNWLAEESVGGGCACNTKEVISNKKLFILSAATATVALVGVAIQLTTSAITVFGVTTTWINFFYYGGSSVFLLGLCQLCLPQQIGLPAIYMFLCAALYMNINWQLQYYYTATPDCFVNIPTGQGPGFTDAYYQTITGYVGTAANLGGVILFDRYVQNWNVRAAFWVTCAVNCCTTIFDVILIERWNQGWFGYDPVNNETSIWVDRMFFILGAQAMDRLVDMLNSMPQMVLIGKLCPKSQEAQVFAVLAALSNFGSSVAYVNGSIATAALGVSLTPPDPESGIKVWECENPTLAWGLSAMAWSKIIATCVLPLSTVPFTFCLLPDVNLADDLLGEENGRAETELATNLAPAGTQPPVGVAEGDGVSQQQLFKKMSKQSVMSRSGIHM